MITVCKFAVAGAVIIDLLSPLAPITVAKAVHQEVVIAGVRYPDAAIAKQRIDAGQIAVESPPADPDLDTILGFYGLGPGEMESILLAAHKQKTDLAAVLVVDDLEAYVVSDRIGIRKALLLDFLVKLVDAGKLTAAEATSIVQAIQSRYPKSFVDHALHVLSKR